MKQILRNIDNLSNLVGNYIPTSVVSLSVRIVIFLIFWMSVQQKIAGVTIPAIEFGDFTLMSQQHLAFWSVTDITVLIFENEYALPLLPPTFAAYLATIAEFFLSLFVLFGFLTRFSAVGFLIMTAVIQFFVYPDAWVTHLTWTALLLVLIKGGPGKLSVDETLLR